MLRRGKLIHKDSAKDREHRTLLRLTAEEIDSFFEAADRIKGSLQYWARTRLMTAALIESEDSEDFKNWQAYLDKVEKRDGQNQTPVQSTDTE